MQNKLPFNNIGIAGLGLIGGSFAKAFSNIGINVYGYDLNKNVLVEAIESEVFQGVTDEFQQFISFPLDLLYICLPVDSSIEFINELGSINYEKAVTDSCSTKLSIEKAAKENNLVFCGGHPIKGKETSGYTNSESTLFHGAKHILTSAGNIMLDKLLYDLHKLINMEVIEITAYEHDKIFANVSHLPHLISFCLMDTVCSQNKNALSFAGGGFKDFTRIAASDPLMWRDIFFDNKKALIECIEYLEKDIKKWKTMIENNEKEAIYKKIEEVSMQRRMLK